MNLPDIWGEGTIFAISGLETKTDWFNPTVGTLLKDKVGFKIHSDRLKEVWLASKEVSNPHLFRRKTVLNDFIELSTEDGISLRVLPLDTYSFIFKIENVESIFIILRLLMSTKIYRKEENLFAETDIDITQIASQAIDKCWVVDSIEEVGRVLAGSGILRADEYQGDTETRYLVSRLKTKNRSSIEIVMKIQPVDGEVEELSYDIDRIYRERLKFYRDIIPQGLPEDIEKTYIKAFSTLKVNVESPQGVFRGLWTTPDRYPHRHQWLWDSAFHSIANCKISPELGKSTIRAVLETQDRNGSIFHWWKPDGEHSDITQPPVLSWASLILYKKTKDEQFLREVFPKLSSYLDWYQRERKNRKTGLLGWVRSDESGMDNSSRFNKGAEFSAIDFNSFWALDLESLAEIADIIGGKGNKFREEKDIVKRLVNEILWDEEKGIYLDRYENGEFSPYITACSFLPFIAEIPDKQRAESLIKHLLDPQEFWSKFPVPSEALNSPTFDNNMWRGPVWINYNYLIIKGLERYGYYNIAREIAEKTIREVVKWYKKDGTIYEFYDPYGEVSPAELPRKDTYGAIKEFGWSCSLFIELVDEYLIPKKWKY